MIDDYICDGDYVVVKSQQISKVESMEVLRLSGSFRSTIMYSYNLQMWKWSHC